MSRPVDDLTGRTFGRLTVIRRDPRPIERHGRVWWVCGCACGGEKAIRGSLLKNGQTTSCGCAWHEQHRTHGMSATPTYAIWRGILRRCGADGSSGDPDYAGRGIKACERWRSFDAFFADMGERPTPAHTVERKDNDGNYEPDNCRWATRTEQNRNKRTTKLDDVAVMQIRWLCEDGGFSKSAVGRALGISNGYVGKVARREAWQ